MNRLEAAAWSAREKAYPWKSGTKVGCAIQVTSGAIFVGWNVEGLWQTSIHAEVSAVSRIGDSEEKIVDVVIASECDNFTPCGACLDWLMQFSTLTTRLIVAKRTSRKVFVLADLYPSYPKQ